MMLSERIAYFYQVASLSFAISIMLNLQPIIIVTLYLMIFVTVYAMFASKSLRGLSIHLFSSSIIISPNPSRMGDKVRVRATITPIKKNLPAIVKLDLGELELIDGSKTWSGLLREGELSLNLSVRSLDPGIKFLGPLKVAVMDPLGVVVKELEIHPRVPLFVLETDKAPSSPSAYSSSIHPSPGLSRDQFVGVDQEYRISLLQQAELPARMIDWRRTARWHDEKVYVKLYDKFMKGELVFGTGSGLDIVLPNGLKVYSRIIHGILAIILPHLEEGSRIWLMRWSEEAEPIIMLIEKSRVIDAPKISRIRSIIYVTRLIDEREIAYLRRLILRGATVKLILINLGEDLFRISKEKWVKDIADLEMRRLENGARALNLSYVITGLDDFYECLRRILVYKRSI